MIRQFLMASAVAVFLAPCAYSQVSNISTGIPYSGPYPKRTDSDTVPERGKKSFYPADQFSLEGLPHYASQQAVSGTIRIWGSNYFKDGHTAQYWEEGFKKYHPDAKFEYTTPNSIIAITGLVAGAADLGVGPKIIYNDLTSFAYVRGGYYPLEIRVVSGAYNVPGWNPAFGIFVNKSNPISKLTMAQLDGIFGAARAGGWDGKTWHWDYARGPEGNIRTWGQLGLTGEWKDKPIHPLGLNLRAHWSTAISDFLLKGSDQWTENLRMYPGNINFPDGTAISGAEQMVLDVGKDPYAITYSTIAFLTPQTKVLPIASKDGGPYVDLTMDTAYNRTYPLVDAVYMYLDRPPGRSVDPKVKEYLRYILSWEGQDAVRRDGKYLPLTADAVREQLKQLE